MHTGTEFIRLPIILFTMLLLPSYGNGGPTPEDTATDVARKFMIHFLNEEYEEAGEYCLGSVYSYDVMRGTYEHFILPWVEEEQFDDVDDYLDAIDFDSPDIKKNNTRRQDVVYYRELHGVEAVEGAEEVRIIFKKGSDGLRLKPRVRVHTIKHEGVWKIGGTSPNLSSLCADKKMHSAEMLKRIGINE